MDKSTAVVLLKERNTKMALFSRIKKALGKEKENKMDETKLTECDIQSENLESEVQNNTEESSEESAAVLRPECPIYEYIKGHTRNGRLEDGFRIPWIQSKWAPGA